MATDPWAEFEHDPRRVENSAIRASDGDRDVVHRLLGTAYAEGRLDRDELDQRSEQVLAARTLSQLPEIVADLVPARPVVPAVPRRDAAVAEYLAERRNALWGFLSASIICWVIWFATGMYFPWPLFVMLGTGLHLGRIVVERDDRIAEEERRLAKQERKALAKQERRELDRPDD